MGEAGNRPKGREYFARRIPRVAGPYMTDQGLLKLYQAPQP